MKKIKTTALNYLSLLSLCLYQEAIAADKINPEAGSILRVAIRIVNFHGGFILKAWRNRQITMKSVEVSFIWMDDEDNCEMINGDVHGPLIKNLCDFFMDPPNFTDMFEIKEMNQADFNFFIAIINKTFFTTLLDLIWLAVNKITEAVWREYGRSYAPKSSLFGAITDIKFLFYCPRCGLPYTEKPKDGKCRVCQYPTSAFRLYPLEPSPIEPSEIW